MYCNKNQWTFTTSMVQIFIPVNITYYNVGHGTVYIGISTRLSYPLRIKEFRIENNSN